MINESYGNFNVGNLSFYMPILSNSTINNYKYSQIFINDLTVLASSSRSFILSLTIFVASDIFLQTLFDCITIKLRFRLFSE